MPELSQVPGWMEFVICPSCISIFRPAHLVYEKTATNAFEIFMTFRLRIS
jgi:hypothetical protein